MEDTEPTWKHFLLMYGKFLFTAQQHGDGTNDITCYINTYCGYETVDLD